MLSALTNRSLGAEITGLSQRTGITEHICCHARGCDLNSNQTKEADSTNMGFLLMKFYWTESLRELHMLFFVARRRVMDGGQGVQSVISLG